MTDIASQGSLIKSTSNRLRPRIALYTHDTFGLGHVRRCMHIIKQLSHEMPQAAILLITGSPALHYFKNLPHNVDIVKIPTIVKTGSADSLPSHLPIGLPELTHLRSSVIHETLAAFAPDVFVVDNFPLGAQSELLPALKMLKGRQTKTVLGLRDILDCPNVVRSEWRKHGIYDAIERYYDKVLVYGVRGIFDAIKEYKVPPSVQNKFHFCGYLTATDDLPAELKGIREKYAISGPFILATGGGGGDAFPLLSTLIDAVQNIEDRHTLIFTGPMMGEGDRAELKKRIGGNSRIILKEFVQDLRPYLLEADVLVAMCGYNIAAEIVYHGMNAIIAPRTWRFGEHANRKQTKEEKEQILRGKVLADYGYVHMIDPEKLNPEILRDTISHALTTPPKIKGHSSFVVDGLKNAVAHITELVG